MTLPMCPLRKKPGHITSKSDEEYVCYAGINFYALGMNAELCRFCSVPRLDNGLLRCPYSDIYTFIIKDSDGQPSITYDIHCCASPGDVRCSGCPDQARKARGVNHLSTS